MDGGNTTHASTMCRSNHAQHKSTDEDAACHFNAVDMLILMVKRLSCRSNSHNIRLIASALYFRSSYLPASTTREKCCILATREVLSGTFPSRDGRSHEAAWVERSRAQLTVLA